MLKKTEVMLWFDWYLSSLFFITEGITIISAIVLFSLHHVTIQPWFVWTTILVLLFLSQRFCCCRLRPLSWFYSMLLWTSILVFVTTFQMVYSSIHLVTIQHCFGLVSLSLLFLSCFSCCTLRPSLCYSYIRCVQMFPAFCI